MIRFFSSVLTICGILGVAGQASAGTYILYNANDNTGWHTIASNSGSAAIFGTFYPPTQLGKTEFSVGLGATQELSAPSQLQSSTIAVTSKSTGTLQLLFIGTGYTTPVAPPLIDLVSAGAYSSANNVSAATLQSLVVEGGPTNSSILTATNLSGTGSQNIFSTPTGNIADSTLDLLSAPYTIGQLLTLTFTGTNGSFTGTDTTTLTSAPEPTSMTLLGIGIAGMVGYGLRRRRQNADRLKAESTPAV